MERITRSTQGRVLGGVCAGLPEFGGIGTNRLRLLFVLAGLCGGIGVVIYVSCWLVIPADDHDADTDAVRSVVVLAWATSGLVAVVLLAAIGAAATVFGLGWVIFGLTAIVFAAGLFWPSRIPRVAVLLGVLALTLPAVAVGLSPMRLTFQAGDSHLVPKSAAALRSTVFRSGFGTMLIDLRRTKLPSSGTVALRIDAGLRRTIVALPTDSCVKVRIRYDVHTFTGQLASLLSGQSAPPFPDLVLFGRLYGGNVVNNPHGIATNRSDVNGPTLDIDFSSQGGGLYVRDYPNRISPDLAPNWPGFVVTPELRPNLQGPFLKGESKKVTAIILRGWRHRRRKELANRAYVNSRIGGPCVR